MQYLLGALIMAVFFILLLTMGYIGYKLGNKKTIPPPKTIDEEKIRMFEQRQKDFAAMMNYSEEQALQRKKVIPNE